MVNISIIIPVYPPHFVYIPRLLENINHFVKNEEVKILEVIIAASECKVPPIDTTSENYTFKWSLTEEICNASKNRNRGWSIISKECDWIVFLDADDYYHPEKLVKTIFFMGPEVDVILHSFVRKELNPNNLTSFLNESPLEEGVVDASTIKKKSFIQGKWDWTRCVQTGDFRVAHGIITVRASCKQRFPEWMKMGEDAYFCMKIVEKERLIALRAKLMIYTN